MASDSPTLPPGVAAAADAGPPALTPQAACLALQRAIMGPTPMHAGTRLIHTNRFVSRKMRMLEEDDVQQCSCKTARPQGAICCDARCENVQGKMECLIGFCSRSKRCGNMRLQRMQWCPALRVVPSGERGLGLAVTERTPARSFLLEYLGEVLNEAEKAKRMEAYARSGRHFYVMGLPGGYYLDSAVYRSVGAFINHACTPNAVAEFWTVGKEDRVAIFTTAALEVGEEVTLDYGWGTAARLTVCVCASRFCRALMNVGPDRAF